MYPSVLAPIENPLCVVLDESSYSCDDEEPMRMFYDNEVVHVGSRHAAERSIDHAELVRLGGSHHGF